MKLFKFFVVAAAAEITLENIEVGGRVTTIKAAKEACAAIIGITGSYQLPVPTSEAYNEVLLSFSFPSEIKHPCVPLGISDSVDEGVWINFYTG